jgi:hypothetical protein
MGLLSVCQVLEMGSVEELSSTPGGALPRMLAEAQQQQQQGLEE